MKRNKTFEFLYGYYLHLHHHHVPLREMDDLEKEKWEKIGKDLEELEHYRKVKAYIDRLYEKPFYQKTESGHILKYEQGEDYHCIEYDFEDDAIDIIDYESVLFIKVEDIEKEIIFYNEDIEKQHQKQEEEEERKWEEQKKNDPIWCCAVMNCTSGGNKDEK